jgi:hypothetical protein
MAQFESQTDLSGQMKVLSWNEVLLQSHHEVENARHEKRGASQRDKGLQVAGIPVGGIVEVSEVARFRLALHGSGLQHDVGGLGWYPKLGEQKSQASMIVTRDTSRCMQIEDPEDALDMSAHGKRGRVVAIVDRTPKKDNSETEIPPEPEDTELIVLFAAGRSLDSSFGPSLRLLNV